MRVSGKGDETERVTVERAGGGGERSDSLRGDWRDDVGGCRPIQSRFDGSSRTAEAAPHNRGGDKHDDRSPHGAVPPGVRPHATLGPSRDCREHFRAPPPGVRATYSEPALKVTATSVPLSVTITITVDPSAMEP